MSETDEKDINLDFLTKDTDPPIEEHTEEHTEEHPEQTEEHTEEREPSEINSEGKRAAPSDDGDEQSEQPAKKLKVDGENGGADPVEQQQQPYGEEIETRTNLFVSSLPPAYTDEMLSAMFSPFGKVHSTRIMRDWNTGISRGTGFVNFSVPEEAVEAIKQMDGKTIMNRTLVVKFAEVKDKEDKGGVVGVGGGVAPVRTVHGTPSSNIYVKGLPPTMGEKHLLELFGTYGQITSHKLMTDRMSGLPNGQAFILFTDQQAAEYAISALNGYIFSGASQGLTVRYADTKEEKDARKTKMLMRAQMGQMPGYGYPMMPGYGMQQAYGGYPPYGGMGRGAAAAYPGYPYGAAASPYGAPTSMYGTGPVHQHGGVEDNNLYVTNLPPSADDAMMYKLFSPFGSITSCRVIKDKMTGRCQGYGFVKMADYTSAATALQRLNGTRMEDKYLSVAWKTAKRV